MTTRTRFLVPALLLGASAVAGEAQAQPACPPPTLQQCRSPQFLDTDCGRESIATDTSSCTVRLRDLYRQETEKPDVTVEPVMLPDQPGVTAPAATKKYQFSHHRVDELDAQFLGTEQRAQLWNAAGGPIGVFDGAVIFGLQDPKALREAWTANGNAVRSCREATHERFMGFTRFKDLSDVELVSDEALVALAYDPVHGIASKTLFSKSGLSALPPVKFPSNGVIGTVVINGVPRPVIDHRSPKNGFFKAWKSLATGSFFGPNDTAMRTNLAAGQSTQLINWAWHQQMATALSAYDPETLRHWDDMQADFLAMTAERDKVLALIARHGPTMPASDCGGQPGCVPATRDLTAELAGLEAALRSSLNRAQAEGCLDRSVVTKCDWSHRQLREQVVAFYSKQMEAAYQTCVANTGNNFEPSAPVRNAIARYGQNAAKHDYSATAEDVEAFGAVVSNWVASQPFPKDAEGNPQLGGSKHDSGRLGTADVSLNWSYDAGWAVTGLNRDSQACNANLSLHGSFAAEGRAYGSSVRIIDASAKVFTENSMGKAKLRLLVLDQSIWSSDPTTPELAVGFVKDMKSRTTKGFSTTVYPFGIPVTLAAGIGMQVGMKIDARAKVDGTCTSTINGPWVDLAVVNGTITPSAQADAYASAAIGVPGFRAGVKCNLVLVRGEMPINANAKIVRTPHAVNAALSFSGRQKLSMLDGSLKAFTDGPWGFFDSEWTLFSWQGPKIDQELFNFSVTDLPLNLVQQHIASSGNPPAGS